jgi:hypothetical protein
MTALLVFVGAGFLQARVFVLPHVLESSGRITTTTFAFDTSIFVDYVGGIGTVTGSGGATVDLYLFDNTGAPMKNNGQDVCGAVPCSFTLTAAARKLSIAIDTLISAKGGSFDTQVKVGFGIVVIGGADPDNVALQGFVVNSHSSALDLSVFGFDPVPLAVAP